MSGYLYLLAFTFGTAAVVAFAIWISVREARQRGRAEQEAETNQRMADHAEAQGRVIAEHREKADTSRRLGDGSF